jgi:anaerobic magnesium-protoporphyrin IX monomethyl ester cyclase
MKIRLIEPAPAHLHMWSYTFLPRLGLPLIGAALKAAGHDVVIYCPQFSPIDWDDLLTADLVGVSTTTSTAPAGYEIAARVREHGVPTVVGGSHVTFMADEALAHVDYVARGEGGEHIMLELIEAMSGARALDDVAGLSFLRDGTAVHNPLRDRCADLDELPFPDLRLLVGNEKLNTTPIMTSWGCPFACNFCSVTAMFGRKYRFRSAESVVAEIKEKKPRKIFFYDDNFAADKARLKKLLRLMIAEGLTVPWGAQVRTDVVRDRELLELMRASGADFVALGLESVNQATLDGYEKSQTVEDIEKAIRILHEYGVRSHGMFVLGADSDTENVVRDTVDFALKNHIDTVMLNILTPLPGTQQFADLEAAGRIITRDWYLYDAQHVVFLPRHMSPATLQREVNRGNRRFFSTWRPVRAFVMWKVGRREPAYNRMLEYGWLWYYSRMWISDKRNRAHMTLLERQRPPAPPRPSAETATAGIAGRRKPD